MLIQWLGQSFFKIQTKNGGDEITVAMDPFDEGYTGLKSSKFQADIVTISHQHKDHNNLDAVRGEPFIIETPGEYEIKSVFIYGIPSWHDDKKGSERGPNTIFHLNSEGINVVHLGDLGHSLTDEELEKIGKVDILMIPVGGIYTIDAQKANDIISELEPRIVIPMHYKISGLKIDLKPVDNFLKISGLPHETIDKLKISKKDLTNEDTRVVILTP